MLAYFNGPNGPPDPDLPLGQGPAGFITLPLYATSIVDSDNGRPVWQTAVEFEQMFYCALMLGGPFAPGVTAAFVDRKPFTFPMDDVALDKRQLGQFDPLGWNFIYVFVVNADGQVGDGGWQRLTVE